MGFLSFWNKTKAPASVVFDIGSKSVGGAIYEIGTDGKPRILYSTRELIPFQKELSGESFFQAMAKTLELVVLHTEKYGVRHLNASQTARYVIHEGTVVLSSPWYISETKLLKLTQKSLAPVTTATVQALLDAEEKAFEAQFTTDQKKNVRVYDLVERKIIHTKLNGYSAPNPFGKKATDVELTVFTSIAPRHILDKIRTTIGQHLVGRNISFRTAGLIGFTTIRDIFPDQEDFLFIQIGGEVTDMTIAKKGMMTETVSFPLGQNALLRNLETYCKDSPGCTLDTLLKIYTENSIKPSERKRIDSAVADTKQTWFTLLSETLVNFSEETFLPRQIFMFADNPYIHFFAQFLREVDSSKFTVTSEQFVVTLVDENLAPLFAIPLQSSPVDISIFAHVSFLARYRS